MKSNKSSHNIAKRFQECIRKNSQILASDANAFLLLYYICSIYRILTEQKVKIIQIIKRKRESESTQLGQRWINLSDLSDPLLIEF